MGSTDDHNFACARLRLAIAIQDSLEDSKGRWSGEGSFPEYQEALERVKFARQEAIRVFGSFTL